LSINFGSRPETIDITGGEFTSDRLGVEENGARFFH
jgi:hypothetical protein